MVDPGPHSEAGAVPAVPVRRRAAVVFCRGRLSTPRWCTDNGPLLKKVMCPPEIFPAVTVVSHLVHHVLALPVLVGVMIAYASPAPTFPWTVVSCRVCALGGHDRRPGASRRRALGPLPRSSRPLANVLNLLFFCPDHLPRTRWPAGVLRRVVLAQPGDAAGSCTGRRGGRPGRRQRRGWAIVVAGVVAVGPRVRLRSHCATPWWRRCERRQRSASTASASSTRRGPRRQATDGQGRALPPRAVAAARRARGSWPSTTSTSRSRRARRSR